MKNMCRVAGMVALLALAGTAAADPATVPPRAASGKSLVIPDATKKLGTVYHVQRGKASRGVVKFSSEAVNEKFDGVGTDIAGFVVTGPTDNPAKLSAGAWRLGVKSLDTKLSQRNEHLQGKDWLNADSNPDITFALKDVSDIKLSKEMQNGPKTYTVTLKGEMTINGKSKEMEIPNVTLIFITGGPTTEKEYKGDVLAVRCKYEIKLADFGVANDVITSKKKVAEVIKIDQELMMATGMPEEQPAPAAAPAKDAGANKPTPAAKPEAPKEAPKGEPKKQEAKPEPKPVGG